MEVTFGYPLLRVVNRALPDLRNLRALQKEGKAWQSAILFVGPWAVATCGDYMTVAYDATVENERATIFFPRVVRRMFRRRGRVAALPAVWEDGAWTVSNRMEVSGRPRSTISCLTSATGGWAFGPAGNGWESCEWSPTRPMAARRWPSLAGC